VFAPGGHVSAQSRQEGQQTDTARPFRGLFGSSQRTTSDRSLILNGSIYGGWDSSVLADQPGSTIDTRGDSTEGAVAGGTLGLVFSKRGRRAEFGGAVDTQARYYPEQRDLTSGAYNVGFGTSIELTRRTRLGLNQTVGYQPYYQLSMFPAVGDPILGGVVIPSNLDYVVSRASGWIYDSSVNLDRQLSRRANLSMFYRRSASDFSVNATTGAPAFDVDYQYGGFRFTREVARGVALRLGYAYRKGNFANTGNAADDTAETHEIDAGVNYARQLSFSRRTTLSFSTGSTILEFDGNRNFTVTGDATLRHQFGRNWLSSIAYNRGVGFITNFSGPVLSDNATLRLDGLLGQRVMLSMQGGLASGRVGYGADEENLSRFTTYTGTATMQYAFTANLASYVQYAYFYYDFPRSPELPIGGQFNRNSVRVGLSVSVPLLR
jgi:opacity protein-like surface antigen